MDVVAALGLVRQGVQLWFLCYWKIGSLQVQMVYPKVHHLYSSTEASSQVNLCVCLLTHERVDPKIYPNHLTSDRTSVAI